MLQERILWAEPGCRLRLGGVPRLGASVNRERGVGLLSMEAYCGRQGSL